MDYKTCSIIPTKSEIFYENNDIVLEKYCRNHRHPYNSIEQYLERQFYLLREDCFLDLKNTIRQIRNESNRKKDLFIEDSNVWFYQDVYLQYYTFNNFDIVYCIKFKTHQEIDWTENKQLRFGSLLFLSHDYFQTYYVATVAESNSKDLSKGYLQIHFVDCPLITKNQLKNKFHMLEMQPFYESYVHILNQLQIFDKTSFPFPEYIVFKETTAKIVKRNTNGYHYEISLNDSQKEAYEAALTQNISIIQGPPGTGKTTVGFAVVKQMLKMYKQNGYRSPILIVCYTNHALDQFLEKIMEICKDGVLRIGSQSTNERVKECNINSFVSTWISQRRFSKTLAYERCQLKKEMEALKLFINSEEMQNENLKLEKAKKYEELLKEFKELGLKEHQIIMESMEVIGMTTTACARYARILNNIGIEIVIIEEAAEILEAHVVCSISAKCQQLIMIGDHKQLQPASSVYYFNDLFDFNCSLFERLIDKGFKNVSLKQQRRMCPDISRCIMPIYPELTDHPNVLYHPKIEEFKVNIYFFDHKISEKKSLKTSFENPFEVKFVIGICSFLLDRGIEEDKITVLTTYKGQNVAIRNKLKCNIKSFVVDNYQGEENDIIILSLVRSNMEENIGYLSKENRICVALSRARYGLYIVGNYSCMRRGNLWAKLSNILGDKIGSSLPAVCKRNTNHKILITCPEDFNSRTLCLEKCDKLNTCGLHNCTMLCHDGKHNDCESMMKKFCQRKLHKVITQCYAEVVCFNIIMSSLVCGHIAKHKCHEKQPKKCIEMIDMELNCSHFQSVICGTKLSSLTCNRKYEQKLDCGHSIIDCITYTLLCNRDIEYQLKCGHMTDIKCFEKKSKLICDKYCTKRLVCGHKYKHMCVDCIGGQIHNPCNEMINIILPCQHSKSVKCSEKTNQHKCYEICAKRMECGHICKHFCVDCDGGKFHKYCNAKIDHKLSCEHMKSVECSSKNSQHKCYEICNKRMTCDHICKNMCLDCDGGQFHKGCIEKINYQLPCHHMKLIACSEKPLKHKCYEICDKRMKCNHLCKYICKDCDGGLLHKSCQENINHNLKCRHSVTVKCSEKELPQKCSSVCSKRMECGHLCTHICKDCDNGDFHKPCNELISHMLPCRHLKNMKCCEKTSQHKCYEVCGKRMECGHNCVHVCKDCNGGDFHKPCMELISKQLLCQHNVMVKCSEKDLFHACDARCLKAMPCGHIYDHFCKDCEGAQIHKACIEFVLYPLPCQHNKAVKCSEKSLIHTCYEICLKRMACGHQCKNVCHKCNGGASHMRCQEIIKHKIVCGHKKTIKCYNEYNEDLVCEEVCKKKLICGHICDHYCIDCDSGRNHQPCIRLIYHKLPCKHVISIKCSDKHLRHNCTDICGEILSQCGHSCLNLCQNCLCGRLHKSCIAKCKKTLSCGHVCKDLCHISPCKNCVEDCLITVIKNFTLKSPKVFPEDILKNWIKLKDSFDEQLPFSAKKTLVEIVNFILSNKCTKNQLNTFSNNYKFFQMVLEFYNEIFLSTNFFNLNDYKHHILESICKIIEWLNPIFQNITKLKENEFKSELLRVKDLVYVCQLYNGVGVDKKPVYLVLLDEIMDVKYNDEMKFKFKQKIVGNSD